MNYLILRKARGREFRVYPESQKAEGEILYTGHKNGLADSLLIDLIDIKTGRERGKCVILKYDENVYIDANSSNMLKTVLESWDSALAVLEKKSGKFRKVTITLV
jgi:hypothetical protein